MIIIKSFIFDWHADSTRMLSKNTFKMFYFILSWQLYQPALYNIVILMIKECKNVKSKNLLTGYW